MDRRYINKFGDYLDNYRVRCNQYIFKENWKNLSRYDEGLIGFFQGTNGGRRCQKN